MTRGYTTRLLGPDEHEGWDRLAAEAPEGSPYLATGYLEVLCRSGGGDFRVLGVFDGDQLVGGVPLYERDARSGGRYVQPRLLLYYNGVVLRDYDTRYPSKVTSRHLGMMVALERGLSDLGYGRVELRCRWPRVDLRPFLEAGWQGWPTYTYVVPLSDTERLWGRIDQNLRRLVGRAEESGVRVTEDDDFDSYYRLHRTVHEEKGAPLYLPEDRYRSYFEGLRERGLARLYHARLADGRSVSAQIVLASDHPVTHTVSAAADPEHYDTGASPFLRWRVFQELSAEGYEGNDLTDASMNSVSRFKRQLGSDLRVNLVVRAPDTWRFRLERRATGVYHRLRAAAARLVR